MYLLPHFPNGNFLQEDNTTGTPLEESEGPPGEEGTCGGAACHLPSPPSEGRFGESLEGVEVHQAWIGSDWSRCRSWMPASLHEGTAGFPGCPLPGPGGVASPSPSAEWPGPNSRGLPG